MKNPFLKFAGQPYMPSNGTEGMNFTGNFCDNCIHQHPDPDKKPQCEDILLKSLCGDQPKEWIYDSEGSPTCTAFVDWNWGNDDDGWNDPPEPEPDDPNQLCFPYDIIDILKDDSILVTSKAIFEKELFFKS